MVFPETRHEVPNILSSLLQLAQFLTEPHLERPDDMRIRTLGRYLMRRISYWDSRPHPWDFWSAGVLRLQVLCQKFFRETWHEVTNHKAIYDDSINRPLGY